MSELKRSLRLLADEWAGDKRGDVIRAALFRIEEFEENEKEMNVNYVLLRDHLNLLKQLTFAQRYGMHWRDNT